MTARQNRGEGNAGQNRGGGRAKSQNFWSSAFCFDIKCYINTSIQITKNQEKESFSFPQNIMACKGYRAEQERRPSKKPELQLFVWTVCLSKVKVKVKSNGRTGGEAVQKAEELLLLSFSFWKEVLHQSKLMAFRSKHYGV